MECVMEGGNKYGKIPLSMRDTGSTIKLMEEAGLFTAMETCTKETGRMIRPMEKVYIFTRMGLVIQGSGIKIYNTDSA